MTSDRGDHDQDQGEQVPSEHPDAPLADTVDELERQQAGDEPGDEEQVRGDDVSETPDADEMEGLPGPPSGEPAEPAG